MSSKNRAQKSGSRGVVADGRWRAHKALLAKVKSEVEAKYRKEMREAALWRRWLVQLKVRREIRRRLEEIAPEGALYLHSG